MSVLLFLLIPFLTGAVAATIKKPALLTWIPWSILSAGVVVEFLHGGFWTQGAGTGWMVIFAVWAAWCLAAGMIMRQARLHLTPPGKWRLSISLLSVVLIATPVIVIAVMPLFPDLFGPLIEP